MLTPPAASQQAWGEGWESRCCWPCSGTAGSHGHHRATVCPEHPAELPLLEARDKNLKFLPQGQHQGKLSSQESRHMSALCRRNRGWAFPKSKPHGLAAERLRRANGAWHRTQFAWKGCGAQNTRSRWMVGRAELVCLPALLKISTCASLEGGRIPFLHSGAEINPLQLGLAMQSVLHPGPMGSSSSCHPLPEGTRESWRCCGVHQLRAWHSAVAMETRDADSTARAGGQRGACLGRGL